VARPSITSALLLATGCLTTAMPGQSHRGALPPATVEESEAETELRRHVQRLAAGIGERHVHRPEALHAAAGYIEAELRSYGYAVAGQPFEARGVVVRNLEAELRGTQQNAPILIVGGHYDSAPGTPGANDNGSGVAATLLLARRLAHDPQRQTIRFVFWTNEEPPFFMTELMGSVVYARRCRERHEQIAGVLSLETLGYYSDSPGTQHYPTAIRGDYPDRGDFVTFVSDRSSRDLLEHAVAAFRRSTAFPAEGLAAPRWIDGVGWSDHWAFWQEGYPGVMVTDTAPFRYRHYHRATDTPDKLVYDRLSRVVLGMERVVRELAR
jgi:Zn-dependent M28 family amino/carboxypeptidase